MLWFVQSELFLIPNSHESRYQWPIILWTGQLYKFIFAAHGSHLSINIEKEGDVGLDEIRRLRAAHPGWFKTKDRAYFLKIQPEKPAVKADQYWLLDGAAGKT